MERTKAQPPHSSSYGQACLQCYKAKCRCAPQPGGQGCERCFRLHKECVPADTIRKRNVNGRARDESNTRIADLEDKLATLVSAMQTVVNSSSSSGAVPPVDVARILDEVPGSTPSLASSSPKNTPANSASSRSSAQSNALKDGPATEAAAPPQATRLPLISLFPIARSSLHQVEQTIDFFRIRMLPCFCFLSLSQEMTAPRLQIERPFLLQAIQVVTTLSTSERQTKIDDFKQAVFSSALIDARSSLDLLQGVLTYLTWSTDAFLGGADLVSRLMMLAISLVYDLRLFKPSPLDVRMVMALTQGHYDNSEPDATESLDTYIEKHRSVLACFVLSSNISSHLGRIDALRWTPQMDEALRVIERNSAGPADKMFISQVRLQSLKQKATHLREQHDADNASSIAVSAPIAPSMPSLLYLKTLRSQLDELMASMPQDLPQKVILITYAQYVDLYINQLASSIASDAPISPVAATPFSTPHRLSPTELLPGYARLESLWRSVLNVQSWLDHFYTIPSSTIVGLPFHFWSQMILCVTILKYLSVLQDPEWDNEAVRGSVNLLTTMDRMVEKLEGAMDEQGLRGVEDSLLKLLARLLRRCRVWGETWFGAGEQGQRAGDGEGENAVGQSGDGEGGGHAMPDLDQMFFLQSMDLDDDQWFRDALGWSGESSQAEL